MPDTNIKNRFPRFPAALLEYAESVAKDSAPEAKEKLFLKLDKVHERYAALDEKRESNEHDALDALADFRRSEFPAIERAVQAADGGEVDFNSAA